MAAAEPSTVPASDTEAAPLPVEQSVPALQRVPDPREEEDWFLRLPAARQQELRDYWDERRLDGPRWRASRGQRARRLAREGAVLLCVPLLLVNGLLASLPALFGLLAWGALAGAGVGLAVHAIGAGRFGASLIGSGAWLLVQLTGGRVVASGSMLSAPPLMFVFLGLWLASTLFAVWGQRIEFRQLEGGEAPVWR